MAGPKEAFKFVHPKNKDGQDDKQMVTITLNRKLGKTNLGDAQAFLGKIAEIAGIDSLQPVGVYTFQLIIANTFDFDEVLAEITAVLETATSAVIIPLKNAKPKIEV